MGSEDIEDRVKQIIGTRHRGRASEAVRELRWVHMLARDLQLDVGGECIVQVDNNQVVSFKYGTCVKSRLRGMISNRWNWVMDLKDEGVDLTWVASKYNMADILTKCLANKEQGQLISCKHITMYVCVEREK